MKNWFERLSLVLCSLVLFSFQPLLSAQTPAAQSGAGSTLSGNVEDEVGAVIPGAKITIVLPGGKQRVVTAGANGEFSIPNIPAGVYNFFVQFKGFQPFVIPDLKMPHDGPLKVTMVVGQVEMATDVVAESSTVGVEPDQNMSATVLDENFIKTLPDDPDELLNVLQAMAGPGAGGANGGQGGAEIMINGFRGGQLPPKETILKITINQNPYSAEFSSPGFGRIEITTKPGNDKWRGTIGTNFRSSALDARNAFAIQKPDVSQQSYNFNISGPLIKKRMSMFAFGDRRNLDGSSTTNAITTTGPLAANVYAPSHNTFFGVRVDYLINQKNTMGINFTRSMRDSENQEFAVRFASGFGAFGGGGRGGGGGGASGVVNFTLPERGTDSSGANNDLQLTNTTILSARLINEARVRLGYDTSESKARTSGVAINVSDAFNGGGSPNVSSNSRQFNYEIQDYMTYTLKSHTIKGGVQVQHVNQRDYSLSNFNGTYTFPSLAAYCQIAGISTCYSNGANGGRGIYQFTVSTGNPLVRYAQTETSLFINDDYRLSQTFTLSLGLRSEFQTNLQDKNNFAPRIGIAWSPFKDRKTTFRFGGGLFYQRLSEGTYALSLRYNGLLQQNYVIQNPTFNPNFKPGDPLPQGATQSLQTTSNYILDPNLKAPYSASFSASVERQLPKGLVVTANYIYSRGVHQFRLRNINAIRIDPTVTLPANFDLNSTRPDPTKGDILQVETTAKSEYNGLQIGVNRRMGQRFMVFSNYSLSFLNNDSDGTGSRPANSYDLKSEWGPSSMTRRHTLFVGGRVSLFKGISLSPFIFASSGAPYNIMLGTDANRDNSFNDRPAGIGRNAPLPASLYSQITGCRTFNSATNTCTLTLSQYLATNFPNGIDNIGPGMFNVNMSLSKTFGFGKRKDDPNAAGANNGGGRGGRGGGGGMGGGGGRGGGGGMMGGGMGGPGGGGPEGARYTLQLTAQISNIFNRVNFGQYSGTLTSPYFAAANSAGAARQFELSMRFGF